MSEWCEDFNLIPHCNEHGDEIEVADCVECSGHMGVEATYSPAIDAILRALPEASEEQREAALRELTRKPNSEVRCKKCEHDKPEDISTCLYHCANGEMFAERKESDGG